MAVFTGKTALITGGTSGIGFATAQRFIAEGAHVFITGRNQQRLDEAVQKLGGSATGVQGDVANLADLDRLFTQIKQEKGTLDVVFANAGIAKWGTLGSITEEDYDAIFNGNVKGMLFTVQKALPLMPNGATVVLNGSVVGSKGFPNNSVYSATKAAVRSFARTWTSDLKDRKIRVNVVSPGPIDTEGLRELTGGASEQGDQTRAGFAQLVPAGRIGHADEIASAVVFLASEASSFVTGVELFVDGGFAQV